ncbi:porin family protein [Chryseobacterium lactis]|uniref:porin family protein n=1 Tax=Chryseobacterium lactis TaxID=1241981 RepID=UPI001627B707|nr:porin family protein [Chryseobacterium lactis]
MKKKNIFFVLTFAFSTIFNAQEQTKNSESMSFGVKGGYNLSNMQIFGNQLDSKSYFYAGIVAEQPLSPKLAVQAEVLYTQLGGKDSYPWFQVIGTDLVEMGNTNYEYQFNQIQVPISLKYYFIPNLSASAGMNLGFNLSSKVKTDNNFNSTNDNSVHSIKTLNIFPFLGAEYKINEKFFVDARYNFDFIRINKSDMIPMKIGFLQAGVGYRFK